MNDREASEAFVRLAFAAQAPLAGFGAKLEAIAPGEVRIAMPITEALTTLGTGVVMGGVMALVADVAAGLSIITRLDPPRPVTTIDFSAHQIAPARGEQLLAVGRAERVGRQIGIDSADVFVLSAGAAPSLVARLTASFLVSAI